MPESILPFTTHSTGIQHESFIAALSVLQKTDIVRLLHAHKLTDIFITGAFMENQTTQHASDCPAERVSHKLNKVILLEILYGFQLAEESKM